MRLTLSAFAPRLRSGIIPFGPNLTHLGLLKVRQKTGQRLVITSTIASLLAGLFLPLLGFISASSPVQAASWWNEDYRYRQQIDITSGSNQSNTYITLTLDTSDITKFKNDCSDLRFIDFNNQTIPYYIASGCGTASTQVQLLFTALPAGTTSLYLYYANPTAQPTTTSDAFNSPAAGISTTIQLEQKNQAPIANWKLDEGYGTITHSTTASDLPASISGATWQPDNMCPSGRCLQFDGVDDYLDIATSPSLAPATLTLSAWVRPATITGRQSIIAKAGVTADKKNYLLRLDGGRPYFTVFSGADGIGNLPSQALPVGRWSYVVGTWDGTQMNTFINGALVQSTTPQVAINGPLSQRVTIGGRPDYPAEPSYFNGIIDNPKIYDYARTQTQIQQDYITTQQQMAAQLGNLSNGLVGHWNMDEPSWNGTPGEVKDSSGNDNHGTVSNAVSPGPGKFGNAANFSSSSYISVNNSDSLSTGTAGFTYSTWLYRSTALGIRRDFFSHKAADSSFDFGLFVNNDDKVYIYRNLTILIGTTSIQTNTWYNLVITKDTAGNWTLWLNGAKEATGYLATNLTNAAPWYFGSNHDSSMNATNPWQGRLDETRIYNRALSATEVSQIYNYTPAPILYYDFEQATGSTVYDKSGNNNNGTWSGTGQRYTLGSKGKSATFNGTNDTIRINSKPIAQNITSYSVSLWINIDAQPGSYRRILEDAAYAGTEGDLISLYFTADGTTGLYGRVGGSTSGWLSAGNGSTNLTGSWKQLTLTIDDSGAQKTYVNGTLISTYAAVSHGVTSLSDLYIGSSGGNLFSLKGNLDDFKIYNYALSQDQVIADMQSRTGQAPNPLAYWKFDDNQGNLANDSSAYGNTGSLTCDGAGCVNPVWTSNGKQGSALSFDSSTTANNAMVTVSNSRLHLKTDLTISAWIKPSSVYGDANGVIVRNGQGSDAEYMLVYSPATKRILFSWYDNSSWPVVSTATNSVPTDTWSHVVAVRQGIKLLFYLNGAFISSSTVTLPTVTAASLSIGRNNAPSSTQDYSGVIDDLKIYGAALTPAQVAIDYNQSASLTATTVYASPASGGSQQSSQPSAAADSKYCVPGSADTCSKPVAHYTFDDAGSTVKDISGNSYYANWYGTGQHTAAGKYGKAGQFNGIDDAATTPDYAGLNLTGSNLTLSAWLKPGSSSQANFARVLHKSMASTIQYNLSFGSSNELRLLLNLNGTLTYFTSPIALTNTAKWYFVSATYDGTIVRFYLDGNQIYTVAASGTIPSGSGAFFIGNQGSYYYNGLIDDVRIYNYARTPAQVAWDYNNGGPVVSYKLNECSGTTIHDSSLNQLHGSLNLGSAGVLAAGNCNAPTTAWGLGKLGKDDGSLSFDGVDDMVTIPNNAAFSGATGLTISAWVKAAGNSNSDYPRIVGKQEAYSIYYDRALNQFTMAINIGGTAYGAASRTGLQYNTWYHLVGTYDGNRVRFYVNGKREGLSAVISGQIDANSNPLTLGNLQPLARYWNGQLDNVQLYNYALTQDQIRAVYTGGSLRWGQ